MPPARPGAPRLIEWTGERCVPWAPDVRIIYEHYHRYLWTQPLVTGFRVLDLGSGEGFGAALLADTAREVVGIDVDPRTVEHSRRNYAGGNLEFNTGSATDLSEFPDETFDVVVAFEVIEHIRNQEAMLTETKRVLVDGGLLVLSTPERRTYSQATGYVNPFHEQELTQEELAVLLGGTFSSVALFLQDTVTGSRIESLERWESGPYLALQIERAGDDWRMVGRRPLRYVIAVASDSQLPELPGDSTLSDFGLELLREAESTAEEARAAREELEAELAARSQQLEHQRLQTEEARQRLAEAREQLTRVEHSVT